MQRNLIARLTILTAFFCAGASHGSDLINRVTHHHADNQGVKIHYATVGAGPMVVMIHGFPDYWYTWRAQMEFLSSEFKLVAVDLRGYNRSDKPKGVDQYKMHLLVSDIIAVIRHLGQERATVVGHDWGGAIAWSLAMAHPEIVERLIICNLPHFRGLLRELAHNPKQQENSQYARNFQQPGAYRLLNAELLIQWVKDPHARKYYRDAMGRSDFEAMLNYYQANYPREPYTEDTSTLRKVKCPVLMIHGLEDPYLLPGALNDTWDWLAADFTLVTIPHAGHFVQHDATDLVNRTLRMWLNR